MKFILTILFLIVCLLELTRGYDYDEDDIRIIAKRQANYYNNYDYNAETTTVATTKKKLIKKCPTNAAGNRIKCKKKKKKTTTSTTPEPAGIPASFLRGPPGINPISFFVGPGLLGTLFDTATTKAVSSTVMSTLTTKVTSIASNSSIIPTLRFGGNLVGIPMITGRLLPTGSPMNSSFSHELAALVSAPSLNISVAGENTKISPAGAIQLGMLSKMMKSFDSSASTNVDPIVSGVTVDSTTPLSLVTTTGLSSKLGSLVAPIASSGFSLSSLNNFMPNMPITSPQNISTTAKPAGLSNATNSLSNTTISSTSTVGMTSTTTLGLRPMNPMSNLTTPMPIVAFTSTTASPNLTTASSNMGSLLAKIGFPSALGGLPVMNLPASTSTSIPNVSSLTTASSNMGSLLAKIGFPSALGGLPVMNLPASTSTSLPNLSPLTTTSSNMGSLLGKIGLPSGLSTSSPNTTVSSIPVPQTVLPSSTTVISTSTLKTTSVLPTSVITPAQSTVGLSSPTITSSTTAKSGLLLPLQSGTTLLVTYPSSTTVSTSTVKSSLSTIMSTSTVSRQNTTIPNTSTTLKNLSTTIGSAVNGTSTTKSLTSKKSSRTTKKKGKKNKKLKKKKQSKKTTKKNQNGNGVTKHD